MNLADIKVEDVRAYPLHHKKIRVVSGLIGATVSFVFDSVWDGFNKTAVFKTKKITKDVLDIDSVVTIPHEVVAEPGEILYVGVHGVSPEGVVLPTVWASLGMIYPGADPSGDVSADPTLPVWEQVYQKVDEEVEKALTEAKESGDFRGEKGDPGEPGAPGYTPKKGEDYYTEADKQEMIQYLLDTQIGDIDKALDEIIKIQEELLIPNGDEVSY